MKKEGYVKRKLKEIRKLLKNKPEIVVDFTSSPSLFIKDYNLDFDFIFEGESILFSLYLQVISLATRSIIIDSIVNGSSGMKVFLVLDDDDDDDDDSDWTREVSGGAAVRVFTTALAVAVANAAVITNAIANANAIANVNAMANANGMSASSKKRELHDNGIVKILLGDNAITRTLHCSLDERGLNNHRKNSLLKYLVQSSNVDSINEGSTGLMRNDYKNLCIEMLILKDDNFLKVISADLISFR